MNIQGHEKGNVIVYCYTDLEFPTLTPPFNSCRLRRGDRSSASWVAFAMDEVAADTGERVAEVVGRFGEVDSGMGWGGGGGRVDGAGWCGFSSGKAAVGGRDCVAEADDDDNDGDLFWLFFDVDGDRNVFDEINSDFSFLISDLSSAFSASSSSSSPDRPSLPLGPLAVFIIGSCFHQMFSILVTFLYWISFYYLLFVNSLFHSCCGLVDWRVHFGVKYSSVPYKKWMYVRTYTMYHQFHGVKVSWT